MYYKIIYTETAMQDITEKFQYIMYVLQERNTAEQWYHRLKSSIQETLCFMPGKYQLYEVEPWHSRGIRLFLTKRDVVLYSIDSKTATVYIHGVCTAGQRISHRLEKMFP